MSNQKRDQQYLKYLVRQHYQIQEHRIAFSNQIRKMKDKDHYSGELENYRDRMREIEEDIKKDISSWLKTFPIWTEFMEQVKGLGPTLAGTLIAELDIEKAKYPSSIWAYAGLDVVDGEGRSRKKKHLVEKEYEDEEGNIKKTKGISYNPKVKTACWKIGKQFLMNKSPYKRIYNERKKYEKRKDEDISDGHAHARALRYMNKQFLKELHVRWRKLKGLKISEPWIIKQDGHSYDDSQDVYVDRHGNMKNPEQ